MLVLSRRAGESIVIDEDVLVTVKTIEPHAVEVLIVRFAADRPTETIKLKCEESFSLDDLGVTVVLAGIRKTPTWRVRLAVQAPKQVSICRLEIYDAISHTKPKIGLRKNASSSD